ncbi:MAG: CYTH domain-containing protein [Candidatus Omnitrophica bacterium]|nr:CYTH domain-containing protein [Candidatus Omnitrophota bacterium]
MRRVGSNQEVEAKFLVREAGLLRRAAALRSLDGFRVTARSRERQANSYWDTPTFDLRRAKAVLKLRRVGRRFELSFKKEISHAGGVSRRLEVSARLTKEKVRRLGRGKLKAKPIHETCRITRKPLVKLFTLYTDRQKLLLVSGDHRVELALDRVTFRRGGRILGRRFEVEVENLTASDRLFRTAIRALRRCFPGRLESSRVWKGEYGFRLWKRSH